MNNSDSRKDLKPGDEFAGMTYLGGGYYVSKKSVAEIWAEIEKEEKEKLLAILRHRLTLLS